MLSLRVSTLLSLLGVVLVAVLVNHTLTRIVLPGMKLRGNQEIMRIAAGAVSRFQQDFQLWPSGGPDSVFSQLRGEVVPRIAQDGVTRELITVPPTSGDPVNYMRNAAGHITPEGLLGDAWDTPFTFTFPAAAAPAGTPGKLLSAGPDKKFGTPDDMSVDIPALPRVYNLPDRNQLGRFATVAYRRAMGLK